MDKNTISEELLAKYFSGRCTAEEKLKVLEFLSHQDNEPGLMEEEWTKIDKNPPARDLHREQLNYRKIFHATGNDSGTIRLATWYRAVAASFILVSTLASLYWYGEDMLLSFRPVGELAVGTGPGEVQKITLPDGSTVWLNASSRVSFPERFGSTREIHLQGEAFFKVTENKEAPFIIHTGNFSTTVLGTSFNIQAYNKDEHIRVSVATGKVSVAVKDSALGRTQELARLTKDQQIVYYPASRSFLKETVSRDQFSAWIDGQLIFKRTSVMEVARILERRYGKQVGIAGFVPGMTCTFTANFKKDTPLVDVLETLVLTQKVSYTIEENKVIIKVDKCLKP